MTSSPSNRAGPTGWLPALVISGAASGVALVLQNVLRDTWQVRTLPERVMEWLLLFVPLDLFERGLQQLGPDAKEVALTGTVVAMAGLLIACGVLALRSAWTSWRLLGLAVGVWLFAMALVMPVTGAGFFATGLLMSPALVNAGYLLVCLGYACVLIGGRLLSQLRPEDRRTTMADRRALLVGVFGTLVAGGIARLAGSGGGLVGSTLPLAAVPAPPGPSSTPVTADSGTATETATTTASATPRADAPRPTSPSAPAVATLEPLPNPPPPRRLVRDKDGVLTAAGRPKGELAPAITANDDFYVVTKNAVMDPVVDAGAWRLVIDGEVNNPVQVDYRTLRALPAVDLTKTLECISNFTAGCNMTSFGCDLISTARWRGARLSDVLGLAGGLKATTVGLAFLASDEFSAGLPSDISADPDVLIVYEMNDQPLPREHGFPARLLVPGRYGMKNPKWLAGIRATNQEYQGWYEQRGWNKDGIIKTMTRIDVPADGARLPAGDQRIAGIAYAGDRGVAKVEFSTDTGGTWSTAQVLEPMAGKDAMVRWEATISLPAGATVTVTVRTTDGTGEVQTDEFQLPQPDGASGQDAITFSAA